ncbi:MCE family protein [Candidatus Dependentiae bacterium]|nr:MCE family protein [Candidatus Dependentiae bacterium]
MKKRRNDILVGFFTLIAIVIILYSIINIIKISKHKDYYKLYSRVENVANLEIGTKIFLQGYEIGKVSEIRINQNNNDLSFLVTMQIKKDIILYKDTKALVSGLGLFGDMTILMILPEFRDEVLKDEDYLVLEQDIGVKELVSDVKETIRDIDEFVKGDLKEMTAEAKVFVKQISTVISDNADSFSESIVLLNKDLKEFHKAISIVNKLVGRNENTINELLENIHSSSKNLKDITADFTKMSKTSTEELNKMAKNLAITSKNFAIVSEDIKKHPWKLLWKKDTDIKKAVKELENSIEKEKDRVDKEKDKEKDKPPAPAPEKEVEKKDGNE